MCDCPDRPKCQMRYCEDYACWSVHNGRFWNVWPHGRFLFVCEYHNDVLNTPMPGIDRPANAGDDWRPSINDHIKLSIIRMNHEKKMNVPPIPDFEPSLARQRGYTASQVRNLMALRSHAQAVKVKLVKTAKCG